MNTRVLRIDCHTPDAALIAVAAEVLRKGGLVVFPTETVYGLAADACNPDALARVFEVKGRPPDKPLPVQVTSGDCVEQLVTEIPTSARKLMRRFWPGALTIVFYAVPGLLPDVTAGTGKVGIRVPDHPVALALIESFGRPIVAPSANLSDKPPPITAEEAHRYLDGSVELVLDAGLAALKAASTVVDVTYTPPRILREGAIRAELIRNCVDDA